MQLGGTTKYVATKFAVGSGSGQKLAMLRKLPEVTNSDLPWCHGSCHGAMVKPMVGIVLPLVGTASNTYKDTIPTLIMTVPTHIYPTIRNSPHGRWKVVVELGGWRRVCGSD